jgi:phospholipase/carboxylesterase
MREVKLGGLDAVVTGGPDREGGGDGPVVVLLHGFGAPGDDLVPLWRVLDVPRAVRFVFPAAPVLLGREFGGGRAWWMIDLAIFEEAMRGGPVRDRTGAVPAGLVTARQAITAFVDEAMTLLAPAGGHLVMGGFSQGAMLACDFAAHDARPLDGLFLLSGTLIAADEWRARLPARRGLRVFQSHGAADPLLSYSVAERLRDELTAAGLTVDFQPFRGGHEIPPSVLKRLGGFLTEVTAAAGR